MKSFGLWQSTEIVRSFGHFFASHDPRTTSRSRWLGALWSVCARFLLLSFAFAFHLLFIYAIRPARFDHIKNELFAIFVYDDALVQMTAKTCDRSEMGEMGIFQIVFYTFREFWMGYSDVSIGYPKLSETEGIRIILIKFVRNRLRKTPKINLV